MEDLASYNHGCKAVSLLITILANVVINRLLTRDALGLGSAHTHKHTHTKTNTHARIRPHAHNHKHLRASRASSRSNSVGGRVCAHEM